MKVRNLMEKDETALKEIIHLANPHSLNHPQPDLIYKRWGEYYFQNCRDHCFVVAEETRDRAVGVILCAPDTRSYQKDFNQNYYPSLQSDLDELDRRIPGILKEFELEYYRKKEAQVQDWLHPVLVRKIYREYPAHLHINIHPEYQRQGLGHLLVDQLLTHLKEQGISGLHLIVSSDNQKGISFYKKYGFRSLFEIRPRGKTGIIYGLKTTH
jgi:ribosomal protein S18 acetylase RimI-like enzyme